MTPKISTRSKITGAPARPGAPVQRKSERGQALTETALYALVAVLLALGLLMFIPAHRTRTAATAAAYACAQALSQASDPGQAQDDAYEIANQTLSASWNSLRNVRFLTVINPPSGPGEPGSCMVSYMLPPMYAIFGGGGWHSTVQFVSRAETWKANWP